MTRWPRSEIGQGGTLHLFQDNLVSPQVVFWVIGDVLGRVRVPYRVDTARRTQAPGPFPPSLNSLGRGVFFGIPCPCPRSGPSTTHPPDGSPLKIGVNKWGSSREWVGVGPWQVLGGNYRKQTPPALYKSRGSGVQTHSAPPGNEH